ncbi:NAD-glutamate dehydrogenase [Streptomyces sp. NRRL S-1448]|nr:NAD-glutamate dehydrogenase [Streptomyces sp. NRRL S-1448]
MVGIALSGRPPPRIHHYDENLPYLVVAVGLALFPSSPSSAP